MDSQPRNQDAADGRVLLRFTRREREAVLHQLGQWQAFPELLERRGHEDLSHAARERARQLHEKLLLGRDGMLELQPVALDREIMACVIEASTWVRLHAKAAHQLQSAVYGSLQSAAGKIEQAFGLKRALRVPIS